MGLKKNFICYEMNKWMYGELNDECRFLVLYSKDSHWGYIWIKKKGVLHEVLHNYSLLEDCHWKFNRNEKKEVLCVVLYNFKGCFLNKWKIFCDNSYITKCSELGKDDGSNPTLGYASPSFQKTLNIHL